MIVLLVAMALFTIGFMSTRAALKNSARTHLGAGLYASFTCIILAGFVLHFAGALVALSGLILFLSVRGRADAIIRLALLVSLVPNVGYAVKVGGHYIADISTAAALTVGAMLVCQLRPHKHRRGRFGVEEAVVIALMLIFSLFQSREYNDFALGRDIISVGLNIGLPFFVFSRNIHNRDEFMNVLVALASAAMISSVIAIFEARSHWLIYDEILRNNSDGGFISQYTKMRGGFLRSPVAFRESTSFAVFQTIGILATFFSRKFFRSDFYWLSSLGLTCLGLLTAQSRGADLALLVGFLCLLLVRRQFGRVVGVGAMAATCAAVLVFATPVWLSDAAPSASGLGAQIDVDYRRTLLRRGLEEGLKNPYFGDDRQRVLARLGDLKQGEEIIDPVNTYLIIFLYSGIFGFVVFILLISGVAMKVWRKDGSARGDFTFLPVQGFLASALGAELTALLFTSFWERNPYWLMIILAGCKTLRITRSPATAEAKSRRLPGEVAETPALADHVHAGDLGAARG